MGSGMSSSLPVNKSPQGGDGIRSLKTSGVFRTLNFELYTRPNKVVMAFGLSALTFSLGYMAYMRYSWKKDKVYTAITDSENLVLRKKPSQWD